MVAKKEKTHTASPVIDAPAGRTAEADSEEWDETQELLNDPDFMKSHARAEKDRANGVSRKFSEISREV